MWLRTWIPKTDWRPTTAGRHWTGVDWQRSLRILFCCFEDFIAISWMKRKLMATGNYRCGQLTRGD